MYYSESLVENRLFMEKAFIVSLVFVFSLLFLNVGIIIKKDIQENEKEEFNQKIENSIYQPNKTYDLNSIKVQHEKEINRKLLKQKSKLV